MIEKIHLTTLLMTALSWFFVKYHVGGVESIVEDLDGLNIYGKISVVIFVLSLVITIILSFYSIWS